MQPIQTMEDLIKILEQHPEWREQLLQVLLTDKFMQLPARVDRLEEAVTTSDASADRASRRDGKNPKRNAG